MVSPRRHVTFVRMALAVSLMGTLAAGCSSDSSSSDRTDTTTTAAGRSSTTAKAAARPFRILVTDDDGVGAAGIDALVEGLRKLPDTEVTVVAPAANQSGTGGRATNGPLKVDAATTASGYAATAVSGFPADTIVWAIDQRGVGFRPDLVVSGINIGQNIGPLSEVSGTVGAARAAAARGIPALAASQGLGDPLDFASGVRLVTQWVTDHRAALIQGAGAPQTSVPSINIPTCANGTLRALVQVPTATDAAGRDLAKSDCSTPAPPPKDDIDAFIHGYPSLSLLTVQAA